MALPLPYPFPRLEDGIWDSFALLRNLQFLASKVEDITAGQLVPAGAILLMKSGTTCPAGYTKITDATIIGRLLQIATTAGTQVGTSAVSVTDPGHLHAVGTLVNSTTGAHTHTVDPPSTTSGTPSVDTTTAPSSTQTVETAVVTPIAVASATHIHTHSHTHDVDIASLNSGSDGAHTHTITGSVASATTGITATITPKAYTFLMCEKT